MGKMKKIKKWARAGAESATRAELAARQARSERRRVEALLAEDRAQDSGQDPVSSAPFGSRARALIDEVKGRIDSPKR
jgi:hypothetical protein